MKKSWVVAIILSLTVPLPVIFTQCANKSSDTSFYLNHSDTVDYVGIEKCRTCHEDKYNSFIETGMGKSFGPADTARSSADFTNAKPVYDPKLNLYYFPFLSGNEIWIHEYRISNGDTTHSRKERISHIIGSGHHTNSHFWSDNGYLFQAPLTYYTQSKKWDLPPGYETINTRFSRKIDIECMSCHNAMPSTEITDENGTFNTVNKFSRLPAGIDCERCHGPGELHVAEKSKGIVVDTKKEIDRTIVNPSKLPWKLQVDVCQRCHLQGNNVLKPGKSFTNFKPGMNLDDVFVIYNPGSQQSDEFYMAGHADRFQQSACFIQSNKSEKGKSNQLNFTCISCHDPHVSVKKTNTEKFNNTCKSCHTGEKGNCTENETKLAKMQNNCVGCHMPANNTQDIPHVTVHDHYIRKPGKPGVQKYKGKTLYAVNSAIQDNQSELKAYISWYEKFDPDEFYINKAITLSKEIDTDAETIIHLHYSNRNLQEILPLVNKVDAKNTTPWTCYRIAKAYENSSNNVEAENWLEKCIEKDPYNIDFANEYASLLIQLNKSKDAMVLLNKMIEKQSKNEKTILLAGISSLNLKDYKNAILYLRKALMLNPDLKEAYQYLAMIYKATGDTESAKKAEQQASLLR